MNLAYISLASIIVYCILVLILGIYARKQMKFLSLEEYFVAVVHWSWKLD